MFNSRKLLVALAVPLMVTAGAGRASADTVTFSNTAGQAGGTFTVGSVVTIGDNSTTPTSSDGRISSVNAFETGVTTGITGLCGGFGCLELQTGAFAGEDPSPVLGDYLYSGSGSYVRIYGTADGAVNTLLYSGVFDPNTNIRLIFDNNCFTIGSTTCTGSLQGNLGPGTIDPTLAAFLGVSPIVIDGNSNNLTLNFQGTCPTSQIAPASCIVVQGPGAPQGVGVANVNSLQTNTVSQQSVPEPGSMVLLGSGLLGLARMVRRRFATVNA